jgi:hemerythrin
MERIIWTDNFSLGVGVIDQQHKRLIDMLNQLIDAENVKTNSETVYDLLDAMTKYSKEHFRTEERLLGKYGCPLLDEQKRDHRAYRIKTLQLCQATMLGVEAVPTVLVNYLREWWTHHIQEDDAKYRPFLAGKHPSAWAVAFLPRSQEALTG